MELQDLFTPSGARQIPDEFLSSLLNAKDSNAVENFGTYMPRTTEIRADYGTGDRFVPSNSAGYVQPLWNGNVAHINRDTLPEGSKFQGTHDLVGTMYHEAAHTVQPKGLAKNYGKMKGLQYEEYDMNNEYPKAEEILASLREREANAPAGKTAWDTDTGKMVIKRMQTLNPKMTKEGAKRYIDLRMFPEHQQMHELDASNVANNPSWYGRHVEIIKNIFKK